MKIFKKNQIIIYVIALILMTVGYLNYTNKTEELNSVETSLQMENDDSSLVAGIGDAKLVSSNDITSENNTTNTATFGTNTTSKENATNDEYQIIKAIYRLFVLQVDDDRISFSSEPDKAFESLKTNLAPKKFQYIILPYILNFLDVFFFQILHFLIHIFLRLLSNIQHELFFSLLILLIFHIF